MIAPSNLLRRGIRLPPGGWMLAGMLAFYVLAGLFGRDPWKGEDAIHIGTAWHMLAHQDWLSPDIAGRAFHEPPLYYWTAALTGKLFGGLLPLHEAMRLASALWVMLALVSLYYAGRELYGQDNAAASPLLLAGSMGLILHAHDAQPILVALAAYSGGLGALAAFGRRPRLTGAFYGLALAACLLGCGIAATLPLLLAAPLACWLAPDRERATHTVLIGLAVGALLILPWPWLLHVYEPGRLEDWLAAELAPFDGRNLDAAPFGRFIAMLPWFAFPAFPLAAWTVWSRRRTLAAAPERLPLAVFLISFLVVALTFRPGEIPALLLLPSLALLATPAALNLRRGAANAFDWFAMSTFSLFVAVAWLAWSAMALGWPAQLASRVVALRPGFVGHVAPLAVACGAVATLWWAWLIVTAPRSPYRSLIHWTLGFTAFWLIANSLLLPWFDYGKSYRPVAEAVARALPDNQTCVTERGLTDGQRASLAYFTGIEPLDFASPAGRRCDWLLLSGDSRDEITPPGKEWRKVWEGSRPGDRREKIRLFRR